MNLRLSGRVRLGVRNAILYTVLGMITLVCLLPFIWTVGSSFKPEKEMFSIPPRLISKKPTLSAYEDIFANPNTKRTFANSFFLATTSTVMSLALSAVSAYGMSRFVFRGKETLRLSIFVTQMIPGIFILVPYFAIMQSIGLYDTYLGLLIGYCSFSVPFSAMMLHGYFNTVPVDLDEAALVDGCNRLQAILRVVLPVSLPGLMGTAIFTFLGTWGDLLYVIIMTKGNRLWTVTIQLTMQAQQYHTDWNNICVMAVLSSLPLVIGWIIGQRWVVKGMMSGMMR